MESSEECLTLMDELEKKITEAIQRKDVVAEEYDKLRHEELELKNKIGEINQKKIPLRRAITLATAAIKSFERDHAKTKTLYFKLQREGR